MEDPDDLYPWRRCVMRRQTKTGLPGIQGVYPLSKFEVKKDVQEMEQAANSDTDTDSSIISEDVLISTYPVKPRKTPKGPIAPVKSASLKASQVEPMTLDYDGISVEQALTFLDLIGRSDNNLKAAESEREILECQALSYRCRIDERSKHFMTVKKEQSNFVKTMQGFNSQALRLQMSLKRQNMMLFDVYTVLQRRQKASDSILAEVTNLQATVQNHLGPESTASPSRPVSKSNVIDAEHAETATLRIALSRSREEVVLYKGQCVRTPMGEASVLSIMPGVEKVVLQLSFGRMHVTVRQMVVWGRDKRLNQIDELLAVDSLRQRWTALHSTGGLFVPSDIRNAIQDLAGQGEDEPATDGDEDSANDDTNTIDAIDDINSILDLKRNSNLPEGCSEQSALPMQDGQASSSSSSASASACNGASSAGVPSLTARCAAVNPSWSDYTFPLNGGPSEATSTSSSTSTSSATASASAAGPLSRQALKNILSLRGIEGCQDLTASSALPYILIPPGALPYIVEQEQKLECASVRFCPDALSENVRVGSVGSLVWKGNLTQMRRELISMQNDVTNLENEQNMYIGNVRDVRSQCALLATDTATLRLRTFTRRIRHRNVLNKSIDASKSISLLENNRDSPNPPVQEDTVQLIPLPAPLSLPFPVTVEAPIGRKRSGSVIDEGSLGGGELKRALRGSIAVIKDASGVRGSTKNVTVFFTGATLTREALSEEVITEENCHLIPTPIPSPGQDGTGTIPGKVCGTRRRTRDAPIELTLPPRRRVATPALTPAELPRVVSGKELATAIASTSYETRGKCDEDNEETESQRGADLEDRGSVDSTGKGAGTSTVDSVQENGSSKRKPKRSRRY